MTARLNQGDVLAIQDVGEIRQLRPANFFGRTWMTKDEVVHIFKLNGAYWQYRDKPDASRPHVLLTKGNHSDGFINCGRVLVWPRLCDIFAHQLIHLLQKAYDGPIDWGVSSDHAGADIRQAMARILNIPSDFCEKADEGKKQVWKRHRVPKGNTFFHVEELMTTSGTAEMVRAGVRAGHDDDHGIRFTPLVVIVNRSSPHIVTFEDQPIVSLVEFDIASFKPEECPYCKAGSEAVRPKGKEWERLMATGR